MQTWSTQPNECYLSGFDGSIHCFCECFHAVYKAANEMKKGKKNLKIERKANNTNFKETIPVFCTLTCTARIQLYKVNMEGYKGHK